MNSTLQKKILKSLLAQRGIINNITILTLLSLQTNRSYNIMTLLACEIHLHKNNMYTCTVKIVITAYRLPELLVYKSKEKMYI